MPVESIKGTSPVIIALPYTGTNLQRGLFERLADHDMFYAAPDRGLDRLLAGLCDEAGRVRANFHRFQSDVEFPAPEPGARMRKGMIGVVPLLDRDGQSIWTGPPSIKEATTWRALFYAPYHAALAAQLAQVRARHGHAILLTCHGRPELPASHQGDLPPDIRLSTNMGAACAINLSAQLTAMLKSEAGLRVSLDGRQGNAWTTRTYGRPASALHAIDLEINERNYLGTGDLSGIYDETRATAMRDTLRGVFRLLLRWRPK